MTRLAYWGFALLTLVALAAGNPAAAAVTAALAQCWKGVRRR